MVEIRYLVAGALRPLARAAEHLRAGHGHRILMYHRIRNAARDQLSVSIARFEQQLEYLVTHRRVLALHTVCEELSTEVVAPGVAVTFDDGYTDNLLHALPVLERFGVPATIFVVSGFCDGGRQHARYPHERALHLNRTQLRELAAHPLIEIGSHTATHPLLSSLNAEAAGVEISESRRDLESWLGKPVRYFCYPSGDCTQREVELVGSAGYSAAVTVAPGVNRRQTPQLLLRRTEVTDRDAANDLSMKLDGAYDLPHMLLHRRRRQRFRALRSRV